MKFIDNDISKNLLDLIELTKNKTKNDFKKPSIIFKPIQTFLYWYLFKGAIFDGKYGFLFSKMKFIEEFIINVSYLEKNFKGEKYEILK